MFVRKLVEFLSVFQKFGGICRVCKKNFFTYNCILYVLCKFRILNPQVIRNEGRFSFKCSLYQKDSSPYVNFLNSPRDRMCRQICPQHSLTHPTERNRAGCKSCCRLSDDVAPGTACRHFKCWSFHGHVFRASPVSVVLAAVTDLLWNFNLSKLFTLIIRCLSRQAIDFYIYLPYTTRYERRRIYIL